MPSDLPNELLIEIVSYFLAPITPDTTSKPYHGFLNFTLVSHRWRQVVEPYLYRRIHLSFRKGLCRATSYSLICLIRTLLNRPELSGLSHSVSLNFNSQDILRRRAYKQQVLPDMGSVNDIMTCVMEMDFSNNDNWYEVSSDLGAYIVLLLHILPKLDVLILLDIPMFSVGLGIQ